MSQQDVRASKVHKLLHRLYLRKETKHSQHLRGRDLSVLRLVVLIKTQMHEETVGAMVTMLTHTMIMATSRLLLLMAVATMMLHIDSVGG